MNYEKKYKEVLKKIREGLQPSPDGTKISGVTRAFLEEVFPELAESEDERIRKELITHCRSTRCVTEEGAERIAKWIAWLEKQGEQNPNPCDGCVNRKGCINCENGELRETEHKPTDKVKPKFKKE